MKAPPLRDSGFERELERQTLISEQRRAIILFWTLTAVLVIRILYIILHGFGESDLPGRGFVLLVVGCWMGLEAFTFVFLRRRIREGKERVPWQTYVNSALEVAMPTIAMWILCHHGTPVSALTGSLSYAYFLIIILSPLRLDPWLCIFTGALAVAGYGVLVGSYWQELARGWVGSAALMWRDQPRFQAMLDAGDALREAHIARLRLGAIFPTSHCHKGGLSA